MTALFSIEEFLEDDQDIQIKELKTLFKTTQELPQAQSITEKDIAAKVEAYRRKR
jgi:hypothetical protein